MISDSDILSSYWQLLSLHLKPG